MITSICWPGACIRICSAPTKRKRSRVKPGGARKRPPRRSGAPPPCAGRSIASAPPSFTARPRAYDLDLLNQELNVAHGRVRLGVGEENFVWEWTDTKNALDRMLWHIADSAAEMLTTDDLTRLRGCPGKDCGWLFLDVSKNSRRQWCDMQACGNLAKVRRFRQRQGS